MSLLFILFVLFFSTTVSVGAVERVIHWNTTNLLWATDNPSITVRLGDRLRVICPDNTAEEDEKYMLIYQVSEMSSMSCLLESNRKVVMLCDEGKAGRSALIPVNRKSALSDSLEFQPGHTYYWTSTSGGSKDTISSYRGGLCQSDNMRLQILVEEREVQPKKTEQRYETGARGRNSAHPSVPRRDVDSPAYLGILPANVDKEHLMKVARMAVNGMTGTYTRQKAEEEVHTQPVEASNPWEPLTMDIYKDVYAGAESMLYSNMREKQQQDDITFVVHEDGSYAARSFPLESGSSCVTTSLLLLLGLLLI